LGKFEERKKVRAYFANEGEAIPKKQHPFLKKIFLGGSYVCAYSALAGFFESHFVGV